MAVIVIPLKFSINVILGIEFFGYQNSGEWRPVAFAEDFLTSFTAFTQLRKATLERARLSLRYLTCIYAM